MDDGLHRVLNTLLENADSPLLRTLPSSNPRVVFTKLYEALADFKVARLKLNECGSSHELLWAGLREHLNALYDILEQNTGPLDVLVAAELQERLDFSCDSVTLLVAALRCARNINPVDHIQANSSRLEAYLCRFFHGIQPVIGNAPTADDNARADRGARDTGEAIKRKLRREADDPVQEAVKVDGDLIWQTRHGMYWLWKVRSRSDNRKTWSQSNVSIRHHKAFFGSPEE